MTALSSDLLTPIVEAYEGTPTTTSQDVADYFGREHKHVLRAIRELLKTLGDELGRKIAPQLDDVGAPDALATPERERNLAPTSPSHAPATPQREPNFGPTLPGNTARLFFKSAIEVPGPNGAMRAEPVYRMTRDGFVLLAMGFTGREALKFKLAYIEAFNRMEEALRRKAAGDEDPFSLEQMVAGRRFLVAYDRVAHFRSQEVPEGSAVLDVTSEREMVELIGRMVPREVVQAMLQAGIARLGRTQRKLGGGR